MKFGIEFVPQEPTAEIAYHCRLAEDQGFSNVWITDHFANRNVFVTLGQVVALTNTIKVGTGVTNPFHLHPALIATSIATIHEMSGGRAVLGIGSGDKVTIQNLGLTHSKPLGTVRESVEIIRGMLKGEGVKFEGEHFTINNAKMGFKIKGEIPIYIGAQAPKMTSLSAEIGDGVLINASHPKDYEVSMGLLKEGAAAGKRSLDNFDVAAYVSLSIDKDRDKAINECKIVVAFIAAGSPDVILERHGIPIAEARAIGEKLGKGDFGGAIGAVTPQMIEAFTLAGTPDEVVEKVKALQKMGVTQLVCGSPLGPNVPKAIKLIGSKVMPHFQ
jgi:5,10-methylenetetrahydromethanopterin reductase